MTTHIALLRGINVGGNNLVAMADLRAMLADLGFEDPRTLLQSGNVVFSGGRRSGAVLERHLEKECRSRLDAGVDWVVRTVDEWEAVIANNPLPQEAERDPSHYLVFFLKDAPTKAQSKALHDALPGREIVRAEGRHLYVAYPDGIARSKLNMALIERKLGHTGTARNWNTVRKLLDLARGPGSPRPSRARTPQTRKPPGARPS